MSGPEILHFAWERTITARKESNFKLAPLSNRKLFPDLEGTLVKDVENKLFSRSPFTVPPLIWYAT